MNSCFVTLLIVTYLAWNTNNNSVLDETLSQVTNNLRGDTITFQHNRGGLHII